MPGKYLFRPALAAATCLTLVLSVPPAGAQTDDETVEYDRLTVIGDPAGIGRIAGSAHYISEEDLGRFDYADVHRVLRQVPGLYLVEEEGFGLRPNIGMRGSGTDRSSRITLLEDGILIAPAPYSAPSAYYFPTMARMRAVELRKGSASIKHGPYTTGGALNLLSTQIPEGFAGSAALDGGSYGNYNVHAWAGAGNAQGGWLVETVQQGNDGFKRLDTGGDTGYTLSDYLVRLRYAPHADHEFSVKLGAVEQDGDETYLGLTQDDFAATPYRRYAGSQVDNIETRHRQYQLRHVWNVSASVDVTTAVYRHDFERAWYKLGSVGGQNLSNVLERPDEFADELGWLRGMDSPADALVVRNNAREYYSQGIQSVLGWRHVTGAVEHEVEVGLRVHADEEDRLQEEDAYRMQGGQMVLTTAGPRGSQANRVSSSDVVALFLQDEMRIDDWTVTAGLRHERIRGKRRAFALDDPARAGGPEQVRRSSENVTIPGVGVSRAFNETMHAFFSVHKGFTPPSPGSTASAEESVNYETGLRYGRGAFYGELVGFFNDYRNLVGTCTASTGGGCNIGDQFDGGKVRMHGIEALLRNEFRLDNGWKMPVRASYTYTDAEFRSSFSSSFGEFGTVEAGDELAYLPRHQWQLGAGLEAGDWRADLNASWIDEMRTAAGRGPAPRTGRTDDYLVLDLGLRWAFSPSLSLFGRVENLLDNEYIVAWRPAGARPGKPRTYALGLRAEF